jgi:uncharacterized membrane protein
VNELIENGLEGKIWPIQIWFGYDFEYVDDAKASSIPVPYFVVHCKSYCIALPLQFCVGSILIFQATGLALIGN